MTSNQLIEATQRTPGILFDDYLNHLDSEYLQTYITAGGASLKMVAAEAPETADRFTEELRGLVEESRFVFAHIDTADVRAHLIEEIFFGVAQQVDWEELAVDFLRQTYRELGIKEADRRQRSGVQIRAVAEANDLHEGELYRTVRRSLERTLLAERGLTLPFRIAMLRLCESMVNWSADDQDRSVVLRWLLGRSVPAAQLQRVGLHGRIGRHHARYLFSSTTRWIRMAGRLGFVMNIDLSRAAVRRRPPASNRRGFYYTKAAVIDIYENLRQFIDGVEELTASLIVVSIPHQLVVNPVRGLPAYDALYLRVATEVYDRHRENPYNTLVKIVDPGASACTK